MFTPKIGGNVPIWRAYFFQMGWFNHQPQNGGKHHQHPDLRIGFYASEIKVMEAPDEFDLQKKKRCNKNQNQWCNT